MDNKVLKFNINKDLDKIRFNHYIMQKENLQRTKGTLPRGQFYITINTVSKDLNIKFAKAQRLIQKFVTLGVITNIYKSTKGQNTPSIYQYNVSVIDNRSSDSNDFSDMGYNCDKSDNESDSDFDNGFDINFDNEKPSYINSLNNIGSNESDSGFDNGIDNESDNSKKEYIKKEYLKTKSKNISSAILAEQTDNLWNLYPNKKGKATALKLIPKLIKQYGYEQILNVVKRYKCECSGRDNKYIKQGDTFFKVAYKDYLDKNYGAIKSQQISSRNSHFYEEFKP